jgi:hypothetical protein
MEKRKGQSQPFRFVIGFIREGVPCCSVERNSIAIRVAGQTQLTRHFSQHKRWGKLIWVFSHLTVKRNCRLFLCFQNGCAMMCGRLIVHPGLTVISRFVGTATRLDFESSHRQNTRVKRIEWLEGLKGMEINQSSCGISQKHAFEEWLIICERRGEERRGDLKFLGFDVCIGIGDRYRNSRRTMMFVIPESEAMDRSEILRWPPNGLFSRTEFIVSLIHVLPLR